MIEMPSVILSLILTSAFVFTAEGGNGQCQRDVVVALDSTSQLPVEAFDRTKTFIGNVLKNLMSPQSNSITGALISFSESAAQSLVTLHNGETAMILEREVEGLTQRGTRPSLMKALRLVDTFFKPGNGERPEVANVALIFISAQPSNIIGCLKYANQVRDSGAKIIVVALTEEFDDADGEVHHEIVDRKTRDFINFLGTIAGTPDAVYSLSPNDPKFLEKSLDIADAVCHETATAEQVIDDVEVEVDDSSAEIAEQRPVDRPSNRAQPINRVQQIEAAGQNLVGEIKNGNVVQGQRLDDKEGRRSLEGARQNRARLDDMGLPILPLNVVVRRKKKTTTTTTTTTAKPLSEEDLAAIAFCEVVLNNTEVLQDQFFGNPADCTSFYQCSLETGVLLAKLFYCQRGMFWKEALKQCMPGYACRDRCEEPAVARRGVWSDPTNCRRWFQCSNSISYPACCPIGTAYDIELSTCAPTETCMDPCESDDISTTNAPTTIQPRFDANGCRDRWGGLKRPNRRNPSKYFIHIGKGHFVSVSCPPGTRFDLIECDCYGGDGEEGFLDDIPEVEEEEDIHCWLYFPFDNNMQDYSNQRLWVTPVMFGGAWIDQRIRVYGRGSARISSSGIAIPGLSGADFRDHLTIAMWIKCYSATSNCHGDLFANGNKKATPTIRMQLLQLVDSVDNIQVGIEMSLMVSSQERPVSILYPLPRVSALTSWTHFGMRYDGFALSLFINGTLINEVPAEGTVGVSMTQIVVAGVVANPNQFRGYVDEVVVLPVALDDVGMRSLLQADMSQLAHNGWIDV